jgi:branched-chain amino acid transport system substrate-binding protein
MKSVLGWTVAVLLLSGCTTRAPLEPILIGNPIPRSGPDKPIGSQIVHGIALAVSEIKASEERVASREVAVLHPDSQGTPDVLQAETVRLITVNKVAALLGGTRAAEAGRLGPIAQQYSVPTLTFSGSPGTSTNSFVFCLGVSPADQGRALARFARQDLKADRIAVLTDSRQAPNADVAEAFTKTLRQLGGSVATEVTYADEKEFANLGKQVAGANPGAILIAGAASDCRKLRGELGNAGLKADVPLLFGGEDGSVASLQGTADKGNPIYLATPFTPEADLPRVKAFVKTYQERFGTAPDRYAALAYDGYRLLFEALRRGEGGTGGRLRDELAKINDFDSLTGPLSFTANRSARRMVFIVRMEAGQAKLARPYETEKE